MGTGWTFDVVGRLTLPELDALYRSWEIVPPPRETLGLIASALGIRFDQIVTGDDLMPDAFGLSMNKNPYPQFNPLSFDFAPSDNNGKQ